MAVVGVSVVALAYFGFTRLDPHDDEGYVLVSLQQWLAGGPLYDLVQTQYGPGFYLVGGALFASPLFDLDHHGLRWISLLLSRGFEPSEVEKTWRKLLWTVVD